MNSRQISPLLVAGDIASFVLVAFIGLSSHERDYTPAAFARTVLPFLLPWLASAAVAGLYRPAQGDPASVLKPVFLAWLPAWAVGLLLRTLLWGRVFAPAFAVVTLLINFAFLIGWRAVYSSMQKQDARAS